MPTGAKNKVQEVQPEEPKTSTAITKNHNYHFTDLPQIATITVDGREIPIFSSRPFDRAFLQDYADWVTSFRKPRQTAAEFIRSQRQAAEAKERDTLE